ncbi:MAG TPA: hydrogen gas-evolving membrane-bound hydrogenase subunit E, partial [Bacteroidales bacterium]|nr:hydrogen gas-evolving membrane-bound hydrogenase subunit E [Bacteroidales bacterium]
VGVAANILLVTVSLNFVYRIFLAKRVTNKPIPKEDRKSWLLLAPAVLAMMSLVFGMFPKILGGTLIESALGSVIDGAGEVKLKLWHGFNDVFFLSLFTVAAGFMLTYLINRKQMLLKNWQAFNERFVRFSLSDKFLSGMDSFVNVANKKTQIIQHGYHRYYIMTIMVMATVAMWYQFYASGAQLTTSTPGTIPYYMAGLVVVSVFAVVMAMFSRSRLAAIVAMGIVGYGVALVFMYYGAIDLAITQILAETLIVVLFVLVMQKMPRFLRLSDKKQRVRDLAIAIGFGTVMTLVTIQSMDVSLQPPISEFFIENSWSKAFGKNVVNVILVDFRAMDTLGEIIVLAVAALGVSMLLKKGGKA